MSLKDRRFALHVCHANGKPFKAPRIMAMLDTVVQRGTAQPAGDPDVGILTGLFVWVGVGPALSARVAAAWHRNKWARARSDLESASPQNAASLCAIQSAAFVVCLDADAQDESLPEICVRNWAGPSTSRW